MYIGQTRQSLCKRINGHKSDSKNCNIQKPVGEHFSLPGHSITDFTKKTLQKQISVRNYRWTATIVEQSLTHLVKLGKTYKYIVTCAVMQKSGAGLHTASSCFWDTTTDGTCTVRWENRTMNCIVNVFAIAVVL
uniref:Dynein light chain Tctex-type 3 n=1 Tax=Chelydra serpentina TaxID=8475 RepID=A0A8C3RIC1_CHESE